MNVVPNFNSELSLELSNSANKNQHKIQKNLMYLPTVPTQKKGRLDTKRSTVGVFQTSYMVSKLRGIYYLQFVVVCKLPSPLEHVVCVALHYGTHRRQVLGVHCSRGPMGPNNNTLQYRVISSMLRIFGNILFHAIVMKTPCDY